MWCWGTQKGLRGTWRVSFGLDECEADRKNANCAQMMLSLDVALKNQESQHGHGAAAAWGGAGKLFHVLAGLDLLLTRDRGCVGAAMRQQCCRKCWTAAFGSSQGFWLLKTNVKAVLGCMLEAEQWSSSSFANMVQYEFLVLLSKACSTPCRNLCAERSA